ncbi:hypothetical protein V6Z11_D03G070300 [Gossypium hirsutum]
MVLGIGVPTNTGLLRCSKSCRLRWPNYLRPRIRRGNFTEHEEKMIIHLQALLANRLQKHLSCRKGQTMTLKTTGTLI